MMPHSTYLDGFVTNLLDAQWTHVTMQLLDTEERTEKVSESIVPA